MDVSRTSAHQPPPHNTAQWFTSIVKGRNSTLRSPIQDQGPRQYGATMHDIGLSVLAMPGGKERKHMSQIYQLAYEREPLL